jgi:hypothetical protein
MNLEELFNSSILDELYENESEELETYVIKKNKENRDFYEDGKIHDEILEILKNNISDKEVVDKIKEKIEEYQAYNFREYEYWCQKYFKKGFVDCMRLKKDLQDEKAKDTFFNYEYNSFSDFIDEQSVKNIKNTEKYQELNKKIKEITNKYPRVVMFLEDKVIAEITEEEQQAIIDILIIKEEIRILEEKEIFKLGGKEMYGFLKQMDLLK